MRIWLFCTLISLVTIDIDDDILAAGSVDVVHHYLNSGLSHDIYRDRIEHASHYQFF